MNSVCVRDTVSTEVHYSIRPLLHNCQGPLYLPVLPATQYTCVRAIYTPLLHMCQVYSIYTHLLHMCQGCLYPPATHVSGLSKPLCYTCVRASYTHLLHMCQGYLYPLLHMCQGYLTTCYTCVRGIYTPLWSS